MQKAAPPTVNAYELDVKYQTWRKDIICIAFTYWKQKLHTKAEFLQWNGSDLLPTLFFFFFACICLFFIVFYIPVVMLNKGFVKGSEQKDFRCVSCSFLLFFFIFMIFHNYNFIFFTPFFGKKHLQSSKN